MTFKQLGRYIAERGLLLGVRSERGVFHATLSEARGPRTFVGEGSDLESAILHAMERRVRVGEQEARA